MLLPYASSLVAADERLAGRVTEDALQRAAAAVPTGWLEDGGGEEYVAYLLRRLEAPRGFVEEAEAARG